MTDPHEHSHDRRLTYCRRWNFARHQPIDPLTAEEARRRDEEGELYTVAVGDHRPPDAVIEVVWNNNHVGVWFFDDRGRPWLHYSFRKIDDNRMFLHKITRRQWPEGGHALNEANLIEELTHQPDGSVHREVQDDVAHEIVTSDYRDVPLDINWEPVPRFGHWASIARYNREQPAPTG